MRTLTLGVLIVAGGTLAALPFRRSPALPDASQGPLQATGPMLSELDAMPRVYRAASAGIADPAAAADPRQLQQLVDSLPRWNQVAVPREHRRVEIPLTFDDLAAPIELPTPLQQRFAAVASVQEKRLRSERLAIAETPPMESMMVASPAPPQRFTAGQTLAETTPAPPAAPTPQPAAPTAAASLASASRSEPLDRLPKPADAPREKHWIRQP